MDRVRKRVRVSGGVQCVGFRYYSCQHASCLGLTGWVLNCEDGSVEIEVQGEASSVEAFLDAVARGPRYAQVDRVDICPLDLAEGERSFEARDAWM